MEMHLQNGKDNLSKSHITKRAPFGVFFFLCVNTPLAHWKNRIFADKKNRNNSKIYIGVSTSIIDTNHNRKE